MKIHFTLGDTNFTNNIDNVVVWEKLPSEATMSLFGLYSHFHNGKITIWIDTNILNNNGTRLTDDMKSAINIFKISERNKIISSLII